MNRPNTANSVPKAKKWIRQKMPTGLQQTPISMLISQLHGLLTWPPPRTGTRFLSSYSLRDDRAFANVSFSSLAQCDYHTTSCPRLSFTRHSIAYLFRTTYTPADALTIAALVAYMNAALPPDKHEEFDTAEVTRAAKTLHDHGRVAFEGDTLKLLH
jgi:hypothetical protein